MIIYPPTWVDIGAYDDCYKCHKKMSHKYHCRTCGRCERDCLRSCASMQADCNCVVVGCSVEAARPSVTSPKRSRRRNQSLVRLARLPDALCAELRYLVVVAGPARVCDLCRYLIVQGAELRSENPLTAGKKKEEKKKKSARKQSTEKC